MSATTKPNMFFSFWKINAISLINKGNSRKIGESPQGAIKQIEAEAKTEELKKIRYEDRHSSAQRNQYSSWR